VQGWLKRQAAMRYWKVFLAGLLALILAEVALGITHSVPAVIAALLIGAALMPATFLVFCLDLCGKERVSALAVAVTCLSAIVLSMPLALVLEGVLIHGNLYSLPSTLTIGMCEETAKALAVLWFVRSRRVWSVRQGLALGAAAGAGFAWIETVMYGLVMGLWTTASGHPSPHAMNIGAMNHTLLLRGGLAIFCHVTWTALVAAALWRGRGLPWGQRLLDLGTAFSLAVLLHAVWDWDLLQRPADLVGNALPSSTPLLLAVPLVLLITLLPFFVLGAAGQFALSLFWWESRTRASMATAPAPLVCALRDYGVHLVRRVTWRATRARPRATGLPLAAPALATPWRAGGGPSGAPYAMSAMSPAAMYGVRYGVPPQIGRSVGGALAPGYPPRYAPAYPPNIPA
jgi:RsiW-degrading membrane proteinase PrsW (M82 family)